MPGCPGRNAHGAAVGLAGHACGGRPDRRAARHGAHVLGNAMQLRSHLGQPGRGDIAVTPERFHGLGQVFQCLDCHGQYLVVACCPVVLFGLASIPTRHGIGGRVLRVHPQLGVVLGGCRRPFVLFHLVTPLHDQESVLVGRVIDQGDLLDQDVQ